MILALNFKLQMNPLGLIYDCLKTALVTIWPLMSAWWFWKLPVDLTTVHPRSFHYLYSKLEIWLKYSLMNMRQPHILFNSAKTWHVIVCWFLCLPPNLPELRKKLFCSDVQNNFRFSSGKFGGKYRNQLTITCQVLAELNKIWSCLIFIKL